MRTAGDHLDTRLSDSGGGLNAPHLIDVKVAHALRRLAAKGDISDERGRDMLAILAALPLRRHSHTGYLERLWALRANVTAYDAVYVALAQALYAPTCARCRSRVSSVGGLVRIEMA